MTDERGITLLAVARDAIARHLGVTGNEPAMAGWLEEPGATFVTLTQQGVLRGCIGNLQAYRSLREDVAGNAVAAAMRDPRFQPLPAHELPHTRIEVSLLSGLSALMFDSEAAALAQLRPGVDGVVLEFGAARGTFLPQVWDALPRAQDFLAQLKRKAGLPADFWDDDIRLRRYTVTKWLEPAGGGYARV